MKTKLILFTVIALLMGVAGCKEHENNTIENPSSIENSGTLLGTWYWEKTYTMSELNELNPQTPQNTNIVKLLVFNNDSSWTLTEKDKTASGEKFRIGTGINTSNMERYDSICYYKDNKIIKVDYYRLYNSTLDFCFCFQGEATGGVTRWKYIRTN